MKPKTCPPAANRNEPPKTPPTRPASNVVRIVPRNVWRARQPLMPSTHVLMTGGLAA